MATASQAARATSLPPLQHGERLDQKTFHARYEAMPAGCRAELIGGIVYMPSPQKKVHGTIHTLIMRWLDEYAEATEGVATLLNDTQILGPDSELQADAGLLIKSAYGGRATVDKEGFCHGPPELNVEVSFSTEGIDIDDKKHDYEKAGVREYVIVALQSQLVFWFVRQRGKYKDVPLPEDSIYRSREFPGLWLDAKAILKEDRAGVLAALRQGLATPEHAAFVAKLAKQASKK